MLYWGVSLPPSLFCSPSFSFPLVVRFGFDELLYKMSKGCATAGITKLRVHKRSCSNGQLPVEIHRFPDSHNQLQFGKQFTGILNLVINLIRNRNSIYQVTKMESAFMISPTQRQSQPFVVVETTVTASPTARSYSSRCDPPSRSVRLFNQSKKKKRGQSDRSTRQMVAPKCHLKL